MLIDNLHEYVGIIRNKIRENSILTGGFRQKHAENTKKGKKNLEMLFFCITFANIKVK